MTNRRRGWVNNRAKQQKLQGKKVEPAKSKVNEATREELSQCAFNLGPDGRKIGGS